jgi:hypothetical protein
MTRLLQLLAEPDEGPREEEEEGGDADEDDVHSNLRTIP